MLPKSPPTQNSELLLFSFCVPSWLLLTQLSSPLGHVLLALLHGGPASPSRTVFFFSGGLHVSLLPPPPLLPPPKPGDPTLCLCPSSPAIGCWHLYLPIRINCWQILRSCVQTLSCKLIWGTQISIRIQAATRGDLPLIPHPVLLGPSVVRPIQKAQGRNTGPSAPGTPTGRSWGREEGRGVPG